MTADPVFWALSALIFLPLGGSALVRRLELRSFSAGFSLAFGVALVVLGGACSVLFAMLGGFVEPVPTARAWIPSLGASYALGIDALSAGLVFWLAFVGAATIYCGRDRDVESGSGVSPAYVLLSVGSGIGLLVARDALLLLAFYGILIMATVWISHKPARMLTAAIPGFFAISGWCIAAYRTVYEQSGFYSTELARWFELALYPEEQAHIFVGAGVSVALLFAFLPAASRTIPPGARAILFSSGGVAVTYLFCRLVMPLSGEGLGLLGDAAWIVPVLIAGTIAIACRGGASVFIGYQALIAFGSIAISPESGIGALVLSAAAFSTPFLFPSRMLNILLVASLTLAVAVSIVAPAFYSVGLVWSASSLAVTLGLGFRLARWQVNA